MIRGIVGGLSAYHNQRAELVVPLPPRKTNVTTAAETDIREPRSENRDQKEKNSLPLSFNPKT